MPFHSTRFDGISNIPVYWRYEFPKGFSDIKKWSGEGSDKRFSYFVAIGRSSSSLYRVGISWMWGKRILRKRIYHNMSISFRCSNSFSSLYSRFFWNLIIAAVKATFDHSCRMPFDIQSMYKFKLIPKTHWSPRREQELEFM